MRFHRTWALVATCALTLPLAACSQDPGPAEGSGDRLNLVGSIYPLQYVLQQVAGDAATTSALAGPGVEPHDMELTPDNMKTVEQADLILTLKGFQPAVDDATADRKNVLEANSAVDLVQRNGATDYHFWLDPERMSKLTDTVVTRLSQVNPERRQTFTTNGNALKQKLSALDTRRRSSLAQCSLKDVFTGHPAFEYLLADTSLRENAILGSDPEAEPGPGQLAQAVSRIRAAKVQNIYAEPLVPDRTLQTLAKESGTKVATLDPIEALSDRAAAKDYPGIMAANLTTLTAGQRCSAPTSTTTR